MMQRFKNILVGVDLSDGHRCVTDNIVAPSREAIQRALWLAKINSARVLFVSVLDSFAEQLSAETEILLEEDHGQRTAADHANEVLSKFVDDARQQGVSAECRVVFGKDWVELVREVLRGKHDVIVAGTGQSRPIKEMILGSTGMKLMRKCPCPVWITRPGSTQESARVLAAVDAASHDEPHLQLNQKIMQLATSICQQEGSLLDVIQVWNIYGGDLLKSRMRPNEFEDLVRSNRARVERCCDDFLRQFDLGVGLSNVHVVRGDPDNLIPAFAKANEIDRIVMGTVARTGIAGALMGNTAETILRKVQCSVLAVKPDCFVCPIRVDDE